MRAQHSESSLLQHKDGALLVRRLLHSLRWYVSQAWFSPMVRGVKHGLAVLLTVAAAAAQPLQVTLQLPFGNELPPRIADWMDNEALIRVLVQNTDRQRGYENLILSVRLDRDGRIVARSRDGHPAQPRFSLGPGQAQMFSWREVVSLEALEYDQGLAQQTTATGELPEGRYRLCLTAYQLPEMKVMSQQACALVIIRPCCTSPIVLRQPADGATLTAPPLLQWTPCGPPTAAPYFYRVVVKPRWSGQSRWDAMAMNPARIDVTIPVTQYQVQPSEWALLQADAAAPNYREHVWQVSVYKGQNASRPCQYSPIAGFRVSPLSLEPKPISVLQRAADLDGDVWTMLKPKPISVLQWEVPYEELLSGRPIKLVGEIPPDAGDTLLYVLRLRIPQQLTWDKIRVLLGEATPPQDTLSLRSVRGDGVTSTIVDRGFRMGAPSSGDTTWAEKPRWRPFPGFYVFGQPGDTTGGAEAQWTRFNGGFYVFGQPGDTTGGAEAQRMRFNGGFYVFGLPDDTTQPAGLAGYAPTEEALRKWAHEVRKEISTIRNRGVNKWAEVRKEISTIRNRGVNPHHQGYGFPMWTGDPINEPKDKGKDTIRPLLTNPHGGVGLLGTFIPTHLVLPVLSIELDGPQPPVCNLPGFGGDTLSTGAGQAKYSGYVLNQAVASGAGRASGRTLGAVTRQAPPSSGSGRQPVTSATAQPEGEGGGVVVCWMPPQDPKHPWVGVVGQVVVDENEVICAWPGRPTPSRKVEAVLRIAR